MEFFVPMLAFRIPQSALGSSSALALGQWSEAWLQLQIRFTNEKAPQEFFLRGRYEIRRVREWSREISD
jgi:hypothetical protein